MSKAIVYSGPACSWCERVKVLLQENDYEIEEKSIVNKGNVEEFQNKELLANNKKCKILKSV